MAGRGSQTFKKRQKEQQRKEKAQEKLAKRLDRKLRPDSPTEELQLLTGPQIYTDTDDEQLDRTIRGEGDGIDSSRSL